LLERPPKEIEMIRIAFIVLIVGLFSAALQASEVVILGDSIGEGVALAAGVRGLARISVHIRGPRALQQIARAPQGSTAVLVLGTNDAEGSIAGLDRHIDNLVQAAAKKNIRLIWVGPPCVRRPWDARAKALDKLLSEAMAARNIQYVSMRDPSLCLGRLHDADGVHFKMEGYAYIWQKARAAAGLPPPEGKAFTSLITKEGSNSAGQIAESKVGSKNAVARKRRPNHKPGKADETGVHHSSARETDR
jgi:hypothetical protein